MTGPHVWLDLDQAALDAAYDQTRHAPNMAQVLARYATNSEAVRSRLGQPQRFAYGPSAVEALDVYPTRQSAAPVCIFIHGGAWRGGLAKNNAFAAETFVQAGAHFVVPDFAWVQDVAGNLMPIADQLRRAVLWVYKNAHRFGGDPQRLYVCGHSSGAHFAAVLLTTDWSSAPDGDAQLPASLIQGGMCCSGMYDLKPVRLSARSAYVNFTDAVEQALSPQRHLQKLNAPVIVACATLESPEFQRQARDFTTAVLAAGKPAELLVLEGLNHFEVIETLATPDSLLGRALLEQMDLV